MTVDIVLPGNVRISSDECEVKENDEGTLTVMVPMLAFCEAMADVWASMAVALDEHEKS